LATVGGVATPGPSAISTPGQVGTGNPGVAIPSPVPTPSGNQTTSGGIGQLQNLNDATLVFNNSLVTTALPVPPLLAVPPTPLFVPAGGFGGRGASAALSSLVGLNASEPLSVSSLSAYIAVRSASSASVPGTTAPRVNTFSRYPESPDDEERRRIMEAVWTVLEMDPVGQAVAVAGTMELVSDPW